MVTKPLRREQETDKRPQPPSSMGYKAEIPVPSLFEPPKNRSYQRKNSTSYHPYQTLPSSIICDSESNTTENTSEKHPFIALSPSR